MHKNTSSSLLFLRVLSRSFFPKEKEKEVIQPQVPLRLPCDDLTHLTELRFGSIITIGPYLNPARLV